MYYVSYFAPQVGLVEMSPVEATYCSILGQIMQRDTSPLTNAYDSIEKLLQEVNTYVQVCHGRSKRSGRSGFGRTSFRDSFQLRMRTIVITLDNRKATIMHVPVNAYLPPAAQL